MKTSTKQDSRPSFQFYPKDWLAAMDLQLCSLGAKGLWIQMLCYMFFSPKRGALLHANGMQMACKDLCKLNANANAKEVCKFLEELEAAKVLSKLPDGTMYCRRMYYENERTLIRREAALRRWHKDDAKINANPDAKVMQTGGEGEGIGVVVVKEVPVVGVKPEKTKYLEFVFLLEEEHKKLVERLGEEKAAAMIERLDNYIGSRGLQKKYKDHYRTILNWVDMDNKKGGTSGESGSTGKYDRLGTRLESAAD